ncbi:nuclear transport factor 2 family protein [Flavobacterium laiguense]|uniref:Dehydrogenase n=1 Tax=Flavobacterium laiguense TaxID=2169409 RepID=A0A2U1JT12_9FLAO|nr:nuclear transport factor 2 family protein [Flavobacterium laiguense]PWA08252.1 hypothetical protein DB891_12705 [Flavobacterium laiguense]
MKKMFLALGLSLLFLNSNAQVRDTISDLQLVQNTLNLYLEGQATQDSIMVGKSYHDSWQLKFFKDGKLTVMPKAEYLTGYTKRTKTKTWSGRIVFIDITNDVAIAKVEISTSKRLFTDYFHLMKTTEGWLIVDKISTRVAHKTVEVPTSK